MACGSRYQSPDPSGMGSAARRSAAHGSTSPAAVRRARPWWGWPSTVPNSPAMYRSPAASKASERTSVVPFPAGAQSDGSPETSSIVGAVRQPSAGAARAAAPSLGAAKWSNDRAGPPQAPRDSPPTQNEAVAGSTAIAFTGNGASDGRQSRSAPVAGSSATIDRTSWIALARRWHEEAAADQQPAVAEGERAHVRLRLGRVERRGEGRVRAHVGTERSHARHRTCRAGTRSHRRRRRPPPRRQPMRRVSARVPGSGCQSARASVAERDREPRAEQVAACRRS